VCARQNYLVEDCVLCLVDFAPACFARAVPVSGAPAQLQHLHLASITKPCYCRVASPSLHSVCTPEFGFVASSEITNHTQPKSSTAHVVFDGQVHSPSQWLCGSLFFSRTHRRAVYHYIKKMKRVFNPYTKQPDTHPKNFYMLATNTKHYRWAQPSINSLGSRARSQGDRDPSSQPNTKGVTHP